MGSVCAFKNCISRSYVKPGRSFFRFPKNVARTKLWINACQREDLMEKLHTLHRDYKLCELHFEPHCIITDNNQRTKLMSNALPTLFPELEGCSRTSNVNVGLLDHDYTPLTRTPLEPPQNIQMSQSLTATPSSTKAPAADVTILPKADIAKAKWDTLRRCYTNAINRRLAHKREMPWFSKWKFNDQMSFLLPFIKHHKWLNPTQEMSPVKRVKIESSQSNIQQKQIIQVRRPQQKIKLSPLGSTLKAKLSKKLNVPVEISMPENTNVQHITHENIEQPGRTGNKLSLLEHADDVDIFFLSMARIVKQLPKSEQTSLKMTVSTAILQAEMNYTKNNECDTRSVTPICISVAPDYGDSFSLNDDSMGDSEQQMDNNDEFVISD